ncbi:Uncharacterized protein PBTT_04921 [Plasmodiophora brassicae]
MESGVAFFASLVLLLSFAVCQMTHDPFFAAITPALSTSDATSNVTIATPVFLNTSTNSSSAPPVTPSAPTVTNPETSSGTRFHGRGLALTVCLPILATIWAPLHVLV